MPPRTLPLTGVSSWKCPSCTIRTFTSCGPLRELGPEHPRYINIPEPPQQNAPYRPRIKGTLPVPRKLFQGMRGEDEVLQESLKKSTLKPEATRNAEPGSREEWKNKVSEQRRQNLREGLMELRSRQQRINRVRDEKSARRIRDREEAINRPEREDERLTAPSHNLNLDALMHGAVPDPTRSQRLAASAEKREAIEAGKRQERLDHLHSLYVKARSFIVNQKQLDEAIEDAFGTDEKPVLFANDYSYNEDVHSIWALGVPDRIQDMVERANNEASGGNKQSIGPDLNAQKMKRIAETLTGGEMASEGNAR